MITLTVDGSSKRNGQPSATAGFGVVISSGSRIVTEVQRALCPTCNDGLQTNNRAELRAVQWAMCFLHEMAKLGSPTSLCGANTVGDGRFINGSQLTGSIRTDSEWVVRGVRGHNRTIVHEELWQEVLATKVATKDCLAGCGMNVEVVHVKGHAGDGMNQRADRLAKNAAQGGQEADWSWCRECAIELGRDWEVEVHFKERHLGRDLEMEDEVFGTSGYRCKFCVRMVKSEFALVQHLRDKHEYEEE